MVETLGTVMILVGAGGLGLVGIWALAPGVAALLRRESIVRPVRIDEKSLLPAADATPPAARPAQRRSKQRIDGRLADDIFSELFSLRADVAEMTSELHALAARLEGPDFGEDAAAFGEKTPNRLRSRRAA